MNARPKFQVVTDDKLIAKLCHMVIHCQWYASKGILSMVLGVNTNAKPKFKVVTDDKLIAKLSHGDTLSMVHLNRHLSMVLLCVRG